MTPVFLTAEWRKLAVANYAVDPNLLSVYLPARTELDKWNGTCYVSLVGFMFLHTKVRGVSIPFHTDFEEVNLRFYVRYRDPGGTWRRGVVFIKEIVPGLMLSLVANLLYKEHYISMPMDHVWHDSEGTLEVQYRWKKRRWNCFQVTADHAAHEIQENSEEEFITEHYWGYTKINERTTSQYAVEHPRWFIYNVRDHAIDVSFGDVYGPGFECLNREKPLSVFLAEGSEIIVRSGVTISG